MRIQPLATFAISATLSASLMLAACGQPAERKEENVSPLPLPTKPVDEVLIDQDASTPPVDHRQNNQAAIAAPTAAGVVGRHKVAKLQSAQEALAYMPYPATAYPEMRENYAHFDTNPVHSASEQPVSTFSIDVDTGSYANLRRFLQNGSLPPEDAVRVEEMINYFDYAYAGPRGNKPEPPFAVQTEIVPTPWNTKTHLLRVGIQGWMPQGEMPPSNLVFLVDVSGSMQDQDKLPLLKSSLKLLVNELRDEDRISLVVYAGTEGLVLEPTSGREKAKISAAIDRLDAGGSTNGGAGIQLAYNVARQAFIKKGVNRILLATDGDFNVGITNFDQLKDMVERERKGGVALSTLGFGEGNYNDHLMEQIADAGNGNYSYIDSLNEAHKVLVLQKSSTLRTIAKDVKIQVEFNPAVVAEYRLIGYENRALKREDFNNDKVDAGEIGAGHSVTALYEVALKGSGGERLENLRYGKSDKAKISADELAFLRLRYKAPDGDTSRLIEEPIRRSDVLANVAQASNATRWAAAVAGFGQLLRGGKYLQGFGYDEAIRLASSAHSPDPNGYRGEMVRLMGLAQSLTPSAADATTHIEKHPERHVEGRG